MAAEGDKLELQLGGRPVVEWSLGAIEATPDIRRLVIVASPANRSAMEARAKAARVSAEVVEGGARRQDSIRAALQILQTEPPDLVVILDAARPLVTPHLIGRVLERAAAMGAATAAVAVKDSIKSVAQDGRVAGSLERSALVAVQTPQAFRFDLLMRAHVEAGRSGALVNDDAELVEMIGHPVEVVAGDYSNLKLTTRDDLPLLEAYIAQQPV